MSRHVAGRGWERDDVWLIQCVATRRDERTGEPYRWRHIIVGENRARQFAADIQTTLNGVRAEVFPLAVTLPAARAVQEALFR